MSDEFRKALEEALKEIEKEKNSRSRNALKSNRKRKATEPRKTERGTKTR